MIWSTPAVGLNVIGPNAAAGAVNDVRCVPGPNNWLAVYDVRAAVGPTPLTILSQLTLHSNSAEPPDPTVAPKGTVNAPVIDGPNVVLMSQTPLKSIRTTLDDCVWLGSI